MLTCRVLTMRLDTGTPLCGQGDMGQPFALWRFDSRLWHTDFMVAYSVLSCICLCEWNVVFIIMFSLVYYCL